MVILFRPYLPEQPMVPKSCDSSGPDSENSSDESSLQCRWASCYQAFENLDMLSSHVAKEHGNPGKGGIFFCGWSNCSRGNKGFNARYKMLVHVRTHTNEKPHQCYQCNKSFSRAENLKIHSRSHTGEKPYVCNFAGCGKAYSNSSDRFKHSRTHAVDKPYVCKIPGCPKRYTDPSSLRKHVKTYKHFSNVFTGQPLDLEESTKKDYPANTQNDNSRIPINIDISHRISDETSSQSDVTPILETHRVNEIYFWQQSTGYLPMIYDRPTALETMDRCRTETDQPLDLRTGFH